VRRQLITHPNSNHMIATQTGVEQTTLQSQTSTSYRYTAKPPCLYLCYYCRV